MKPNQPRRAALLALLLVFSVPLATDARRPPPLGRTPVLLRVMESVGVTDAAARYPSADLSVGETIALSERVEVTPPEELMVAEALIVEENVLLEITQRGG